MKNFMTFYQLHFCVWMKSMECQAKLTDCKNNLYITIRKPSKALYMGRLSDYVDFPSPVQIVAVLNCEH